MRLAFAIVIGLHALIHLMGTAKGFGWAEMSQLKQPITAAGASVWLIAGLLLLGSAIGIATGARWWWYLALPGLLASQVMIARSWSDAKFGTIANVMLAVPLVLVALDARASSFRSRFARDSAALLAASARTAPLVTESDLAALPALMQTYLRRSGAVGRPRVRNLRVRFDAQMRSSATAAWMPSSAMQYEFFERPARLFHMRATRAGIPIDVLHEYIDGAATFQVRVLGLFPMVDKSGTTITHDETVTLMNDVLVLAPAAVLDLPFTYEPIDHRALQATFRNAGFTVSAKLTFDAAGDLVGFTSADRSTDREGGPAIWSTPISGYAEVDGIRVGTKGDANWIEADGQEWTYGRFIIREIAYNVDR